MNRPRVDVIIPVHDLGRRFEDAVESATEAVQGVATTTHVVLHNTGDLDAKRRANLDRLGVRVAILRDGIQSPSGPRNAGIEAGRSEFVSFVDSDDVLGPRSLAKLVDTAEATGSGVALPTILTSGGPMKTPYAFARRRAVLDPIRHELFRRSHSFGVIRRSLLEHSGLRFPVGIRTGQDLVLMCQLYTRARTAIALDATYHLRDHQGERLTTSPLPAEDQIASVRHLLTSSWIQELTPQLRQALVARLLKVNLARGWRYRCAMGHEPSYRLFSEMRDRALVLAPRVANELSVRDRRTLRFDVDAPPVRATLSQSILALIPSDPRIILCRRNPAVGEVKRGMVHVRLRQLHRRPDDVTALR